MKRFRPVGSLPSLELHAKVRTAKTRGASAEGYDANSGSGPVPSVSPASSANQGSSVASIRQLGQIAPPPGGEPSIYTLNVVGQIEGHVLLPPKNKTTKYEHVIPQMVAVEQNPTIKGLLVVLNTVGGDIEAGLAIAELIKTMSKPTVSLVLGGGHSIGVPIAVASNYSFIADTATMTIHPIRLTGLVIGVPQTYEYLDKMQDRVIRFIVEHSQMTETRLRELMFRTGELVRDIGTVLIGRDAVREGLIDAVGGLTDAVQKLEELIQERQQATEPAEGARKEELGEKLPEERSPESDGKPRAGDRPQAGEKRFTGERRLSGEKRANQGDDVSRQRARLPAAAREARTRGRAPNRPAPARPGPERRPSRDTAGRGALSSPPWSARTRTGGRRRGLGESLTASIIDFLTRDGGAQGREG